MPLIIRETSSRTDQMRHEDFRAHMSEEEKIAAEESFNAYIMPMQLNIHLQERAIRNPLFLQRTLSYQIEAKHQRRIQMTLSLSDTIDVGVETQKLLPLYVLLARLVSPKPIEEYSAEYKFSRACILTAVHGIDGVSQAQAKFLLPDMKKLALEAKSGSLAILFISFAGGQNTQFGIDSSNIHSGGNCLWSKIPLESLYSSWQKYPNMDLGEKANSVSLVDMQPCFINMKSMTEKCVEIQVPSNPLTSSSPQQMKVTVSAEEVGATENPPYRSLFSCKDITSSSMLPISRLRKGQVAFNYKYYNNKLQKTEVTEGFTCPICLVKCGSFKGLECHMPSTHQRFNFEFWVNEKYQAINVTLKSMITVINEDDLYANQKPYFFSSKQSRSRKQKTPVRNSRQGPHETEDANSVKCEKCQCQIAPGGGESSSQMVPPRMGPADLQMMHMWNSFAKKHRVFADGRIPWGCEAFSKLHGPLMVRNLNLLWCWKKYIWTLRVRGLLDARTVNNCTAFLDQLACKLKT